MRICMFVCLHNKMCPAKMFQWTEKKLLRIQSRSYLENKQNLKNVFLKELSNDVSSLGTALGVDQSVIVHMLHFFWNNLVCGFTVVWGSFDFDEQKH